MRHSSRVGAWILALTATACTVPTPPSNAVLCGPAPDLACPAGQHCELGLCTTETRTTAKVVGNPCVNNVACSLFVGDPFGICLVTEPATEENVAYGNGHVIPSGSCARACNLNLGLECPDGAACVRLSAQQTAGDGVCLQTCRLNAECRGGFTCRPVETPAGVSVCVASCTSFNGGAAVGCAQGYMCQPSGDCRPQ